MKKRKKTGGFSAYGEYRYGETRPIYRPGAEHQQVFVGDQRKHVVAKVTAELRQWENSPFQNEASCRHGIRQALCGASYPWEQSDREAADLVAEGLSKIGARRPTWAEGQPEYAAPTDCCVHCAGGLTDEQLANGDRFCSSECAKAHIERKHGRWAHRHEQVMHSPYIIARQASRPALCCEQCGSSFRPRGGNWQDQKYCSKRCYTAAQIKLPDLECANPRCKKTFHALSADSRYCSAKCFKEHAANPGHEQCRCELCQRYFLRSARSRKEQLLCDSCRVRVGQFRSGRAVPTRVTPIIFDYFIVLPHNRSFSTMITPARFDALLAA